MGTTRCNATSSNNSSAYREREYVMCTDSMHVWAVLTLVQFWTIYNTLLFLSLNPWEYFFPNFSHLKYLYELLRWMLRSVIWTLSIAVVVFNHNVSRDGSSLVIRWNLLCWVRLIELASIGGPVDRPNRVGFTWWQDKNHPLKHCG
jgi:hypothetical protein